MRWCLKQSDIEIPARLVELRRLYLHAHGNALFGRHALLFGKVAHLLRDLHRAELGPTHAAEVRHLGAVFGQGFVVVGLCRIRVQP